MGEKTILHGAEFIEDDPVLEAPDENGQLAVGLKIPTSIKTPTSYLEGLRKYKDVYNNIYRQIEVCNQLYKFNGLIGNAVDVLVDFAVTEVHPNPTGNEKLDTLLDYWFENVNASNTNTLPGIYSVSQEIGLEWFTSGNAFPYNKWANTEVDGEPVKLPDIYLLNPQAIEIPTLPIAFGQEVLYLKMTDQLMTTLTSDGRSNKDSAFIKQAIPRTVINELKSTRNTFGMGIPLNPKYVTHLKRKAKNYQPWGVPYLTRCFSAVSILERLRELDEAVTSGLLNLVTVFKIGTKEFPASQARLQKFSNLLRNPKATTTLVWAHDIEVQQVGPDGKVLAFKDKYTDAKQDVIMALGVPAILMSLPQQGDAWVSVLSLVEKLTNWRKTISIWLESTCNQIAKYNGYEEKVTVKWATMNLSNEVQAKNLILAFYDRGLISIDTALSEGKYDIDHELNAKKSESKIKDKFQPPNLPFSGTGAPGAAAPGGNQPPGTKPVSKGRTPNNNTNKKPKGSVVKIEHTVNLKPATNKTPQAPKGK